MCDSRLTFVSQMMLLRVLQCSQRLLTHIINLILEILQQSVVLFTDICSSVNIGNLYYLIENFQRQKFVQ